MGIKILIKYLVLSDSGGGLSVSETQGLGTDVNGWSFSNPVVVYTYDPSGDRSDIAEEKV